MNHDLNVSFLSTAFLQRHTKKVFGIGAFIWMSASAITAIASQNEYKGNAQMLIASNAQTPSSSYQSQDIQSLKEQLIEKTRELEEYKACLFRPSRPQDQAKINELAKQITELEKNRQDLIAQIKANKDELDDIKKQRDSLEVSSEALTDYIKTQRAHVEEERHTLIAKILAYEEATELERRNNEQLVEELTALKDKVASLDKLLTYHESGEDLQDALLDASMLKFELDETRAQAEEKEKELLVSTLNYLSMAHDHIGDLQEKHESLKTSLNESKSKHSLLLSAINELENENSRLQQARQELTEKIENHGITIQQHEAQKHMYANKLMENEESLNAALAYYEGTLEDLSKQVVSLQDLLAQAKVDNTDLTHEKDYLLLQYGLQHDVLQHVVADSSEAMADTIAAHHAAINEYLEQLQVLEEKFAAEEQMRVRLEDVNAKLLEQEQIRQHEAEEYEIAFADVKHKLSQYESDLTTSQASIEENVQQIEELKEKLAAAENEYFTLKEAYDSLSANNENAEQQLLQYEEDLNSSKSSIDENTKQIEELKEKLALAETEHHTLKQAYEELSAKSETSEQQLSQYEEDLESSKSSIDENIKQIEELQQKLALAETEHHALKQAYNDLSIKNEDSEQQLLQHEENLNASQSSIEENIKQIEELQQKLAAAEEEHHALKEAYDILVARNAYAEHQLLHYQEGQVVTQASIDEHITQIETLKEQLALAESEHHALKQAHEALFAKSENSEQQLVKYEEGLNASQASIDDNLKQIEELQQKLATAETEHHALKEAYEILLTKNAYAEHQLQSHHEGQIVTQSSIDKHITQIETLNEMLAAAEAEHQALKQKHEALSTKNEGSEQQLLQYEEDLNASKTSISEYLTQLDNLQKQLAAAEEAHNELSRKNNNHENLLSQYEENLSSSQEFIAEYLKNIEELQGQLAAAETDHHFLKQAHDELSGKNSKYQHQITKYEEELAHSHSSIAEHLKLIEDLQEKLATAETVNLLLEQAHNDLANKNVHNDHQIAHYENNLNASKEHISENLRHIDELKEQLLAAEAIQLSLKQNHEELIASKEHEIRQAHGNLSEANEHLNQLAAKLSIKEEEHEVAILQLQQLQAIKDQLHSNLNHSLIELEKISAQLEYEKHQSAQKTQEWNHYQQEHNQAANHLKSQVQDQLSLMDQLNQEIVELYVRQIDYDIKENELDHRIRSLTAVAERQDHALAEANSAFSMVQTYNQQLQAENEELKNRLRNLEVAERSRRVQGNSDANDYQQVISPALFKLLKP